MNLPTTSQPVNQFFLPGCLFFCRCSVLPNNEGRLYPMPACLSSAFSCASNCPKFPGNGGEIYEIPGVVSRRICTACHFFFGNRATPRQGSKITRAKRRLPAWTSSSPTASTSSSASANFSPLSFTPPC
jgi:hypothetical protein